MPVENPLEIASRVFVTARSARFWEYFADRRVWPETLDRYEVGWSPLWPALSRPRSRLGGFLEAGLVEEDGATAYPGRATFPYRREDGVCSNILMRLLDDDESGERYRALPKRQVSWPPFNIETPVLYGHPQDRHGTEIALVEGPVDVFRCHQVGIPALGLCGNYINPDLFVWLLSRYPRVTLMLDWEDSGLRQMFELSLLYLRVAETLGVGELYVASGSRAEWGRDPGDVAEPRLAEVFGRRQLCRDFVESWRRKGVDPDDQRQLYLVQKMIGKYRKWKPPLTPASTGTPVS